MLVRLDHVARVTVNANRGAWRRVREREQFGDRDLEPIGMVGFDLNLPVQ